MRISDWSSDVCSSDLKSIMDAWAFPHAQRVREMVDAIGNDCRTESLLPNAPLGAGANAIAILEEEMEELPFDDELGSVLKYAIANGAITIERNYGQGSKLWALIELRSEEHTSELQSLMRISYAVFCLKKKTSKLNTQNTHSYTIHFLQNT